MCDALGLEMPGLRRDAQTSRGTAPPTTRGGEGGRVGGWHNKMPRDRPGCPSGALAAHTQQQELSKTPPSHGTPPSSDFESSLSGSTTGTQRERKTKQGECLSDDRILSSQLKTISSVRHLFVNVLDLEDHDVLCDGDVDGDAGVEYRSAGWCRNVRASAFKSFRVVRPSDTNHFTSLPCKVQLAMKKVFLFYL